MATFGYARVSMPGAKGRKAQHVDNQVERLKAYGCDEIFPDDGKSGRLASRPEWDKCLMQLRKGDTLVVTKLDRIGRSLINLVDTVRVLGERGVQIKSLDQGDVDTTTPNGKLLFGIMAVLAEWEADIVRERTLEGLAAARERHGGKLPGRGPKMTPDQIKAAQAMMSNRDATGMSAARIAAVIGVSPATLYRHVTVTADGT